MLYKEIYGRHELYVSEIDGVFMKSETYIFVYRIRFENLFHGSHGFRARSVSLGEDGNFSDETLFDVDQTPSGFNYNWAIAGTFVVFLCAILLTILYKKGKLYLRPRSRDTEHLLHDRRDSVQSTLEEHDESFVKISEGAKVTYKANAPRSMLAPDESSSVPRPRPRPKSSPAMASPPHQRKSLDVEDELLSPTTETQYDDDDDGYDYSLFD